MKRDWLVVAAALSAACAIAGGAFGAHGAGVEAANLLKTGASYQLPHAVAALVIAGRDRRIAWTLIVGSAIFAGTLYAMAIGAPRWLGAVTPLGGSMLIGAWLWLAFSRSR